jgi:phosphoribosylanthranilate isomerase
VTATAAGVTAVGVLVSPTAAELIAARDAGIRVVQIHGGMQATAVAASIAGLDVWHATSLEGDLASIDKDTMIVLDACDPVRHGGTGRTIDWTRAAEVAARRRVLLAGGLTAANVRDAIHQVRPFGVDVASGIEQRPGVKDREAMRAFVAAVREADE